MLKKKPGPLATRQCVRDICVNVSITLNSMTEKAGKRFSLPFSIALIVLGSLLLFGNIGWLGFNSLIGLLARYWPVIFIIRGVSRFSKGSSGVGRGIRDVALGIVLQVIMLGWLPNNLEQYWPYAFVAIGLWLILLPPRNSVIERTIDTPDLQLHIRFNGARVDIMSQHFRGGMLGAMVAAVDCDLSKAEADEKRMQLKIRGVLSRVRLQVSDEWRVVAEDLGSGLRIDDLRDLGNPPEGTGAPELRISGSLTFATLHILDPEPEVQESPDTGVDEPVSE